MAYENLYNSLSYNIPPEDLTPEEKEYLVSSISSWDDIDKKETVYLLILHDYIKSNPNTKVIFPYKSKQLSNNSLEIKIDALPKKLKRILYKFVKLAEVSTIDEVDPVTPLSPLPLTKTSTV